MKHYGDITKIDGHKLPVCDVVTGGSPCQDLSVAGKRAGLAGERSGLFMEQIRVIKEMREAYAERHGTNGPIQPNWMVWENVPGALSSNDGEDFRAVLEETARIADQSAVIPRPPDGWSNAGCILGDGWSIAWRIHDAQFWGVPQRRKRIALVADFGGERAPEILFERQSLPGHPDKGGKERERASKGAERSTGSAISFKEREGKPGGGKGILIQHERTGALSTLNNQSVCLNAWDVQSKHIQSEHGIAEALYSGECRYGGGESYVMQEHAYCLQGGGVTSQNSQGSNIGKDVSFTLNAVDRHGVCAGFKPRQSADAKGIGYESEKAPTLTADMNAAVAVDVYNQTCDGDIAASLTASCGGTNTSGPKVMHPVVKHD